MPFYLSAIIHPVSVVDCFDEKNFFENFIANTGKCVGVHSWARES